jgi:hypothetical protein
VYLYSIKAREMTIVKKLLTSVTLKNEEKESIHKDALEAVDLEISGVQKVPKDGPKEGKNGWIKRIRIILDKEKPKGISDGSFNFNKLEKLERSIFGVTKKEISDNFKKVKFKSSHKYVFEMDAAHKYSPS